MILNDQPTIFNDKIIVGVSAADDGNMRFGNGDDITVRENREFFLNQLDIDPLQTTLVHVSYADTTDFARYQVVGEEQQGEGMLESEARSDADALVATRPGHALFLPLADCAGVVLYDPINEILMVSHIGRHSAEVDGATRSVQYLQDEFDSDPANLQIWISPAVGSESYPLHTMNNRGLHDVIIDQLLLAGVTADNIEASAVDTAESGNYFSHSEFLAGNRDEDGRFAIVAMMRE